MSVVVCEGEDAEYLPPQCKQSRWILASHCAPCRAVNTLVVHQTLSRQHSAAGKNRAFTLHTEHTERRTGVWTVITDSSEAKDITKLT